MYGVGFGYGAIGATTILKSGGAAFDADAQSFFTASGVSDLTQKNAVNQLVLDLKSNSLWSKMKALYPVVGGSATAHSYNLVNTAQYQLSFSSGWTHSSTGMLPNGTSAYADTGIKRNVMSANSASFGVYVRNNNTELRADIGVNDANWNILVSGVIYASINNTNPLYQGATATSVGFTHISKISSSPYAKTYRNGSLFSTNTEASSATNGTTHNFYIGANNNGGSGQWYSNKQLGLVYFSDGLDATESANFYTCVQTFQTSLSRNV